MIDEAKGNDPPKEHQKKLMSCHETATEMVHVIENDDLGARGVSSVGFVLRLMDMCACAAAQKLSCRPSVTLSMDDLVFKKEVNNLRAGDLALIKSQVNRAFNTSMEVGVTVEIEDLKGGGTYSLCRAYFTFVALGDDKKKTKIPLCEPTTAIDQMRCEMAKERRQLRFRRKDIIASNSSAISIDNVDNVAVTGRRRSGAIKNYLSGHHRTSIEAITDKEIKREPKTVAHSKIVLSEIVLPPHANHMGNTFGGQIMTWMDRSASIVASRHCRDDYGDKSADMRIWVAGVDDVFFVGPSVVGDHIEITAQVTRTIGQQLEVAINVIACKLNGDKSLINSAFWVMELQKSLKMPLVLPESAAEEEAYAAAEGRRHLHQFRKDLHHSDSAKRNLEISHRWNPALAGQICGENIRGLLLVLYGKIPWNPVPSPKPELEISTKIHNDLTTFKISFMIEAPVNTVFHIVHKQRVKWDHVMQEATIVQVVNENNDIGRWVFQSDPTAPATDFALLRSWRRFDAEGKATIASRSVLHPAVPKTDKVRGEVASSGWIFQRAWEGSNMSTPPVKSGPLTDGWTHLSYVVQLGASAAQLGDQLVTGRKHDQRKAMIETMFALKGLAEKQAEAERSD